MPLLTWGWALALPCTSAGSSPWLSLGSHLSSDCPASYRRGCLLGASPRRRCCLRLLGRYVLVETLCTLSRVTLCHVLLSVTCYSLSRVALCHVLLCDVTVHICNADMLQIASESISSIRTVQSLGKEQLFYEKYKELSEEPYK